MRKVVSFLLLATLAVAAMLPAGTTSASLYNYLVFTSVSLDCASGSAIGSITYALEPGAKVVADATVHVTGVGDTPIHEEYVATTNKSGNRTEDWASVSGGVPFPADGYLHVSVKVYDPDGTLASETEAYGECPSGKTWFKGSGVPGPIIEYTPWAAGATLVRDAMLYAMPGQPVTPEIVLPAGKNVIVLGMDESGQYYKVVFAATYLWVEADALGPNYDAVWGGAPLPTQVVD